MEHGKTTIIPRMTPPETCDILFETDGASHLFSGAERVASAAPTVCSTAVSSTPRGREMNEINIEPGRHNYTPFIVEILRNCADGTKITFENATYDFYADGARKEYLCPVCNQSGEKRNTRADGSATSLPNRCLTTQMATAYERSILRPTSSESPPSNCIFVSGSNPSCGTRICAKGGFRY